MGGTDASRTQLEDAPLRNPGWRHAGSARCPGRSEGRNHDVRQRDHLVYRPDLDLGRRRRAVAHHRPRRDGCAEEGHQEHDDRHPLTRTFTFATKDLTMTKVTVVEEPSVVVNPVVVVPAPAVVPPVVVVEHEKVVVVEKPAKPTIITTTTTEED